MPSSSGCSAPIASRAQFAPLAGRIVIGIGRFLERPDVFGDVAEVDADAVPDGGAAAHAIGEDVVFS